MPSIIRRHSPLARVPRRWRDVYCAGRTRSTLVSACPSPSASWHGCHKLPHPQSAEDPLERDYGTSSTQAATKGRGARTESPQERQAPLGNNYRGLSASCGTAMRDYPPSNCIRSTPVQLLQNQLLPHQRARIAVVVSLPRMKHPLRSLPPRRACIRLLWKQIRPRVTVFMTKRSGSGCVCLFLLCECTGRGFVALHGSHTCT